MVPVDDEVPIIVSGRAAPTAAALLSSLPSGTEAVYRGHYNLAYAVRWDGIPALLRVPRLVDRTFDPRLTTEPDLLAEAERRGVRVPRLLATGNDYLVVEEVAHPVAEVAEWASWYPDLLTQVGRLHARPFAVDGGPANLEEWYGWLGAYLVRLWERLQPRYAARFDAIGLVSPVAVLDGRLLGSARSRPTTLVHADLHPANVLTDGSRAWLVDWELALAADPVWEAATALHRTPWPDDEAAVRARSAWLGLLTANGRPGAADALAHYQVLELWKSLVVDTIRYPRLVATTAFAPAVASYVKKLLCGADLVGVRHPDPDEVEFQLQMWSRDELD